jgi:hypothetical protein
VVELKLIDRGFFEWLMMVLVVGNYNCRVYEKVNYRLLMNDYEMDDKSLISICYLFGELLVLPFERNENDHK